MSFLIALAIIALFFAYFYLYFRVFGVKRKSSEIPMKPVSTSPSVIAKKLDPMSLVDLESLTHLWMTSNQCERTEIQPVSAQSCQMTYLKSDPLFGAQFLVLVYACDLRQPEVPVEYLLQFRDCVRMMNVSKGFAITNGAYPSDVDRLFEEASIAFLNVQDIQNVKLGARS